MADYTTEAEARQALGQITHDIAEHGDHIGELRRELTETRQALAELRSQREQRAAYSDSELPLAETVDPERGVCVAWDSERRIATYVSRDGSHQVRVDRESPEPMTLLDGERVHGEWHARLLDLVERRNLARSIMQDRRGAKPTPRHDADIRRHMQTAPGDIRRIFSDVAGSGAEWIPDDMYPGIEVQARRESMVASLFQSVPMSGKNLG